MANEILVGWCLFVPMLDQLGDVERNDGRRIVTRAIVIRAVLRGAFVRVLIAVARWCAPCHITRAAHHTSTWTDG